MEQQAAIVGASRRDILFSPFLTPNDTTKSFNSAQIVPPLAVIAFTRLAFGARPGDVAAFNALGNSNQERLDAYLDQQLDPNSIDDSALDTRLAAAGFVTLNKSLTQLWADHVVAGIDPSLPTVELERATMMRAIYSERQLVEALADFWHNHFNVYGWAYPIRSVLPHFDQSVIRFHMLGNFREMLEAVATHTAMLYYLDNYKSSNAGPNENWARELFELHTMGAENYLGVMRQADVPKDNAGKPIGYVDDDVYEATRCFTGWSVSNSSSNPMVGNSGQFYYRAEWHDRFQKNVLGQFIPADQAALKDGRDVLDMLAEHPGVARFICRKLCVRFVSDNPSQSLIDSAAAVFSQHVNAPDQLKKVYRHIMRSTDFQNSWGGKIKRPFEATVSALRAMNADIVISVDEEFGDSLMWLYRLIGQRSFSWKAPNGYPDKFAHWQGATSLAMRWRLANWLVDRRDAADDYYIDIFAQHPAGIRTANGIVDYWINRILGRPVASADRDKLIEFMAQGVTPTLELPIATDEGLQNRIRSLAALIILSPDFQWR